MFSTILLFIAAWLVGFFSLNNTSDHRLTAFIAGFVMPVISVAFGLGFSVKAMNWWFGIMQITTAHWLIVVLIGLAFLPGLLGVWLGHWATHCLDKSRPAKNVTGVNQ